MKSGSILQLDAVGVRFGGVQALEDVHMKVAPHTVHGLIGPNGAGKTTLLNCITGLIRPQAGSILFEGRELVGLPAHEIVSLGMARTFQNFGLMEDLSVLANVVAGLHSLNPCTLADELFFLGRRNRAEQAMQKVAIDGLEAAGLLHLRDVPVRSLPYGKRKAVELVRAMGVQPRLLLLDEPTAGLSDADMRSLGAALVELKQRTKTTLVIISHHMEFLLGIADSVTVLSLGRLIAEGTPQEIQRDAGVISAYLGSEV